MTWLTDEDRENQKRFRAPDADVPEYKFKFRDNEDGSTFTKTMKNGKAEEWAKKHNCTFLYIDYY